MINIKKGNPAQRGAQKTGSMSYNFAFAGVSDNITLLIFDGRKNLKCRVELDETYKTGDVFSCNISGENLDKAMYCYESDGKYRICMQRQLHAAVNLIKYRIMPDI